jgi:threonine 3-dehydrogenase
MTALLRSGLAEKVEKIITHEFHYTDFEAAFEAMVSGEAVKVILNFD